MTSSIDSPDSAPLAGQPLALALPDQPLIAGAEQLARILQSGGHEAYFVGGAVRNAMLGRPVEDVDIATSAHPGEVAELFPAARMVGAHFGVVLVRRRTGDFDHDYEVATFRAEGSYVDHRRPAEVRFGTLAEDFGRRDFTVNAMYYDPVGRRLVDPAGGRADLERRLLRTVGDPAVRFEEDALRLMRAVRFAVRYELRLEEATAVAIRTHAALLRAISAERLADELIRILTGPHPGRAMHMMSELGLWPHVVPEMESMHGCLQPRRFHPEGDVFVHTALTLDRLAEEWPGAPPALALAALLHDVGKPPTFTRDDGDCIRFPEHQRVGAAMAGAICRRLRLSNQVCERTTALVENHMRFMDAPRMKLATLRRFLGMADFDQHLALHRADCLASHGKLDNYAYCIEKRRELARLDRTASLLPPPLIGGRDLLALGLRPAPIFRELLDAVRDEQLEGRLASREDAVAFVRERLAAGKEAPDDAKGKTT
ncbi:MAG: CCA tRNA nucleotidyltransferase [bacterium]|nr:CCA tRNA nucleotidyltransferase [bacterium]